MKIKYHLTNEYQSSADAFLAEFQQSNTVARMWEKDHTVWKPETSQITNRLGWLTIIERMEKEIPRLTAFSRDLRRDNIQEILLLGMGGSSLAPEVFQETFGQSPSGMPLTVLDTTHPATIQRTLDGLTPEKTIIIVATKSGRTAETLSLFKYTYNWFEKQPAINKPGDHFIGITDPGSSLVEIAEDYSFRDIFLNDPHIGGRYSALSFFGLVPAAMIGIDLRQLLDSARSTVEACRPGIPPRNNPGAVLGAVLGALALEGRDKVTFWSDPPTAAFPNWVEQLLAESTGKEGKGILPVVGEPPASSDVYQDDRVFVTLSIAGESFSFPGAGDLVQAGHPLINIELPHLKQLGNLFFVWEFATAAAGAVLKINPFDQPNVESAKTRAREMIELYQQKGRLPDRHTARLSRDKLNAFIQENKQPGSYIALQAFIPPTRENQEHLEHLRLELRDRYRLATTLGFGPRFLHSTGQLHKGDAGKGLFIQFTSRAENDLPIPDQAGEDHSSITFGTLLQAQALGDARALLDAGRAVIQFSLGKDISVGIKTLRRQA